MSSEILGIRRVLKAPLSRMIAKFNICQIQGLVFANIQHNLLEEIAYFLLLFSKERSLLF